MNCSLNFNYISNTHFTYLKQITIDMVTQFLISSTNKYYTYYHRRTKNKFFFKFLRKYFAKILNHAEYYKLNKYYTYHYKQT